MAKNSEVYKTAYERAEAFKRWFAPYANPVGMVNYPIIGGIFNWLDLEAEEEKPEPCPFCGGECAVKTDDSDKPYWVYCQDCDYNAISEITKSDAISAHNRVAKKCREVK